MTTIAKEKLAYRFDCISLQLSIYILLFYSILKMKAPIKNVEVNVAEMLLSLSNTVESLSNLITKPPIQL